MMIMWVQKQIRCTFDPSENRIFVEISILPNPTNILSIKETFFYSLNN